MRANFVFSFLLISICVPVYLSAQEETDKLNPRYYIDLQARTTGTTESISLEPVITYISPTTNIRIRILRDKIRKEILGDSLWNYGLREIERYNMLTQTLRQERDSLLNNLEKQKQLLAQAKSPEYEKLEAEIMQTRNRYNSRIETGNRQILSVLEPIPFVDLSITAMVILHTGKKYPLEVPGYTHVRQIADTSKPEVISREETSIERRDFRLISQGVRDQIIDTEINLLDNGLGNDDVVNLIIENHYKGTRRYSMRFIVAEHGWKIEFPPNLVFIKRFQEVVDSTGKPINESNFKPAPGGSMLLSYRPLGSITKKLFTGFSIGLNVTLVDFEKEKDFELGLGPVFYYLNHSIGAGISWNLHAREKRGYWFLSLDFLKAFEIFSGIFGTNK